MWRVCSLFSSIAMAWCIMSSCQKVLRSIRNITLKLYAVCVKQYEKTPAFVAKQFLTAHTSLLIRDFLDKNNIVIVSQPPYSPDLASCDFFLFQKLKKPMKGRRFATIEEIKTASLEELKAIQKSAFQKWFEDWKKRWHKSIISKGDYFEGDKIDIDE